MSRGFYSATAAMMTDMQRFETVANNLANINTHGFKRQQTLHHDFQDGFVDRIQSSHQKLRVNSQGEMIKDLAQDQPSQIGALGTGTYITGTWTDYEEGNFEETQNPLDMALRGDGFFAVQGAAGDEPRYTRNGHFKLSSEGQLVSSDGFAVLGQNGPIQLDPAARLSIDEQGRVFNGQQEVDQLRIVNFKEPQLLVNEGGNNFATLPGMEALDSTATVSQGFLEQSNVDVAGQMVQMISALRSYQISQKALQSEDEMSGKLISQVGGA